MIPIFCRLRAANSARLSHGSRRLQICRSPSIFVERQKYHRRVLTVGHKCGILILALIRRCGGMVDTGDLKSPGSNTVPVRVRSPAPSGTIKYRGVEQLVARRAHNPEVGGSSPPSATISSGCNGFQLHPLLFLSLCTEQVYACSVSSSSGTSYSSPYCSGNNSFRFSDGSQETYSTATPSRMSAV